MSKICPKCQYERLPDDLGSDEECPRCGVVYGKYSPEKKIQGQSRVHSNASPHSIPPRPRRFPYGPAVLGLAALFAVMVIGVKFYEGLRAQGLFSSASSGSGHATSLDATAFAQEVLAADDTVLVDFWAPWCGPCRRMGQTLEQVGPAYADRLRIVKINVDDHRQLAQRYGVQSIPTLIFFREGREVGRVRGAVPPDQLRQRIDSALAS